MTRSMITRLVFAGTICVIAAAVAYVWAAPARATSSRTQCSNRTLNGEYGFSGSGHLGPTEVLSVGVVSFDGQGGFELRDTLKVVGGPVLPRTVSGAYDITRDCRGTASFHAPPPFNVDVTLRIVLVDEGREAYFIQTAPDGLFQGAAKLQ